MQKGSVKAFISSFKTKFSEDERRRAYFLLWMQSVLLVLLLATIALIFLVDAGDRLLIYASLVFGILVVLSAALLFNLNGKFRISAWLTIACVVLGPWGSVLLDNSVLRGDIVPLVYLALSIQLCSFLLSELATITVAIIQVALLAVIILTNPVLWSANWPSLFVYVIISATLGIVSSLTSRRQLDQIRRQRNQLRKDETQLRMLSMRDSLTGLYNRRFMRETLEREVSRVLRSSRNLGIIMADVDDFKNINDTFGHARGDSVLCQVANILNMQFRKSDVVCRYGGDEFIIIMPECPLAKTRERAESLHAFINIYNFTGDDTNIGRVTLSFGVAALPENGTNGEELLSAADQALYAAKKDGRNCVKLTPAGLN